MRIIRGNKESKLLNQLEEPVFIDFNDNIHIHFCFDLECITPSFVCSIEITEIMSTAVSIKVHQTSVNRITSTF